MINLLSWASFAPDGEAYHVASYDLNRAAQPDLHTHDFAEICWISHGNGVQIGQNEVQKLEKGTISIIHPEVIHRYGSQGEMTLINVSFPAEIYETLCHLYRSVTLTDGHNLPESQQLSESGLIELNRAVNELVRSPKETAYLWRFLTRCMCILLPRKETVSKEAPDWLQRACEQIQEPERAKEGVSAFVKLAGRSPEHVSRFTKKWTGKAPRELVQDARLELVARELALTNKPILEITLDAGFENLGHCYKLFKQKFGHPPAEYRKSQKRLPAGIAL